MPLFARDETKAKLLILYFLLETDIPLTRDQIYRAMYENECMDYFVFQQVFYELEEEGYVAVRPMPFGHAFSATEKGKETLRLFEESLPSSLREALAAYARNNMDSFRTETQLVSSMEEQADGSYEVRLMAQERSRAVLEIRLSLATRTMAQKVRSAWADRAEEVYASILDSLLNGK